MIALKKFDASCKLCPRLTRHLQEQGKRFPFYFNQPVPAFGAHAGELLIVGLAPGLHGANRTGRPFTGDYAGVLLYETLHEFGYGSHAGTAEATDSLLLRNCRITNAVKCLPPENKPELSEVKQCNSYLAAEIADYAPRAILSLGLVAHSAILRALARRPMEFPFGHGARHDVSPTTGMEKRSMYLFDSYHCSRYNTQTKRLTASMFKAVFSNIGSYLSELR